MWNELAFRIRIATRLCWISYALNFYSVLLAIALAVCAIETITVFMSLAKFSFITDQEDMYRDTQGTQLKDVSSSAISGQTNLRRTNPGTNYSNSDDSAFGGSESGTDAYSRMGTGVARNHLVNPDAGGIRIYSKRVYTHAFARH